MAGSSERPQRRFPDAPDFVGRYVREAFMYLMAEVNEGVREQYPTVTPALSRVMSLLDRDGTRARAYADFSLHLTASALSEAGKTRTRSDPEKGPPLKEQT